MFSVKVCWLPVLYIELTNDPLLFTNFLWLNFEISNPEFFELSRPWNARIMAFSYLSAWQLLKWKFITEWFINVRWCTGGTDSIKYFFDCGYYKLSQNQKSVWCAYSYIWIYIKLWRLKNISKYMLCSYIFFTTLFIIYAVITYQFDALGLWKTLSYHVSGWSVIIFSHSPSKLFYWPVRTYELFIFRQGKKGTQLVRYSKHLLIG